MNKIYKVKEPVVFINAGTDIPCIAFKRGTKAEFIKEILYRKIRS